MDLGFFRPTLDFESSKVKTRHTDFECSPKRRSAIGVGCSKDQCSIRGPRLQPKDQNSECGSQVFFDTQGIDSCDEKTQCLDGDSVPKCALKCNEKYVKPQRPRHILATWRLEHSVYMGIGIC